MEIGVSVTAQTVHEVNLYGRHPKRKPLLTKQHKTARLNVAKEHEKKTNIGGTFFGQMKPKEMCLDQMGSSMFCAKLVRTTTVTA